MHDFKNQLTDYILSGHSLLFIQTYEQSRAVQDIQKNCKDIKKSVFVWSVSSSWQDENGNIIKESANLPPEMIIKSIADMPDNTVCILKEFWPYLDSATYNAFDIVISHISEIREQLSNSGKTIIFLGPELKIPNSLQHDITTLDFSLPDKEQIRANVMFVSEGVQTSDGKKFEIDKEILEDVINACMGLTQSEIIDRVALAIRKRKALDKEAIKIILNEKAAIIKSSGLLTYVEPPTGGLKNIGGYDILKRNILLDKPCFSDKAREFGIEYPKGLLLVGIPGCGKTEISKCIASEFNLPLISFDVGSIMSSYVGSSENNMRQAIKIIESISPCLLQVDEIDKGFSSKGDLDGGASMRVFGSFLKWLSDRDKPVYIIATANDISGLPPEFLRSGRFDGIFFLDLPGETERKTILQIHLEKRKRDSDKFDLNKLVEITKDYTGSDLEQIVKLGLKIAFCTDKELKQDHLEIAAQSVIPLSKIEPVRIQAIREWGLKHGKMANSPNEKVDGKRSRKVTCE